MNQVGIAEALGTSLSVIGRLQERYRMTRIPDEWHPGPQRLTTLVQDRYLVQQARREPTVTAPILSSHLLQTHRISVHPRATRNHLHESNLRSCSPFRFPALRRGNRGLRLQ